MTILASGQQARHHQRQALATASQQVVDNEVAPLRGRLSGPSGQLDDANEPNSQDQNLEQEDFCRFDLRTRAQLLQSKLCPQSVAAAAPPNQLTRSHDSQEEEPKLEPDSISLASRFSSSSGSSSSGSSGAPTPPPRISSLSQPSTGGIGPTTKLATRRTDSSDNALPREVGAGQKEQQQQEQGEDSLRRVAASRSHHASSSLSLSLSSSNNHNNNNNNSFVMHANCSQQHQQPFDVVATTTSAANGTQDVHLSHQLQQVRLQPVRAQTSTATAMQNNRQPADNQPHPSSCSPSYPMHQIAPALQQHALAKRPLPQAPTESSAIGGSAQTTATTGNNQLPALNLQPGLGVPRYHTTSNASNHNYQRRQQQQQQQQQDFKLNLANRCDSRISSMSNVSSSSMLQPPRQVATGPLPVQSLPPSQLGVTHQNQYQGHLLAAMQNCSYSQQRCERQLARAGQQQVAAAGTQHFRHHLAPMTPMTQAPIDHQHLHQLQAPMSVGANLLPPPCRPLPPTGARLPTTSVGQQQQQQQMQYNPMVNPIAQPQVMHQNQTHLQLPHGPLTRAIQKQQRELQQYQLHARPLPPLPLQHQQDSPQQLHEPAKPPPRPSSKKPTARQLGSISSASMSSISSSNSFSSSNNVAVQRHHPAPSQLLKISSDSVQLLVQEPGQQQQQQQLKQIGTRRDEQPNQHSNNNNNNNNLLMMMQQQQQQQLAQPPMGVLGQSQHWQQRPATLQNNDSTQRAARWPMDPFQHSADASSSGPDERAPARCGVIETRPGECSLSPSPSPSRAGDRDEEEDGLEEKWRRRAVTQGTTSTSGQFASSASAAADGQRERGEESEDSETPAGAEGSRAATQTGGQQSEPIGAQAQAQAGRGGGRRPRQQVVAAVVERAISLHMSEAAQKPTARQSLPTLEQVQRQMLAARAQLEQRQRQQLAGQRPQNNTNNNERPVSPASAAAASEKSLLSSSASSLQPSNRVGDIESESASNSSTSSSCVAFRSSSRQSPKAHHLEDGNYSSFARAPSPSSPAHTSNEHETSHRHQRSLLMSHARPNYREDDQQTSSASASRSLLSTSEILANEASSQQPFKMASTSSTEAEPVPTPRFQLQPNSSNNSNNNNHNNSTKMNELTIVTNAGGSPSPCGVAGGPYMNQRIKDLSNELHLMNGAGSSAQSTPSQSMLSDSTTISTTLLTEAEMNSTELIPKLIERLDRKLVVMKKEQFALMKEIEFNETSGQKLFELMRQQLTVNEFDKIQMHANEIEKVTKLILSLKLRLKRTEAELKEHQSAANVGDQQQASFLSTNESTSAAESYHQMNTNSDHQTSQFKASPMAIHHHTKCSSLVCHQVSAAGHLQQQQQQQQQQANSKQQRGLSDPTSTIGLPKRNHNHQHHASLQSCNLDSCQAVAVSSRLGGIVRQHQQASAKQNTSHHHELGEGVASSTSTASGVGHDGLGLAETHHHHHKSSATSTSSDSIFNCSDSAIGSCTITSSSSASGHGGSSTNIEQQQHTLSGRSAVSSSTSSQSECDANSSTTVAPETSSPRTTISHSSLSSHVSTTSSSSSSHHHHHHHHHHDLSSPPPQSHISSNISASSHSSLSSASVPSSPSLMSPTSTTSCSNHHLQQSAYSTKRDTNNNAHQNDRNESNNQTLLNTTMTTGSNCDSLMNLISAVDILMAKRNKLISQLEEAHQLEECIAKRSNNIVERILRKYYDDQKPDGEIALFRQFTKLKSLLLKDSHDISDRIENAEQQLTELRQTNQCNA